jgi:hypothetical protein
VPFRSAPPDPAEFPWLQLVWPSLMPLVLGGVLWLTQAAGHVWNVHGPDLLLLLAFAVSVVLAFVMSVIALSTLVPALREHPTLRSQRNLWAASFAVVSVVACGVLIAMAVYGMVTSE